MPGVAHPDWFHEHSEAIGLCAGLLTTISFAPQVIRTWRKGGDELSGLMLALFGAGVGLWIIYGVLAVSVPVVLANGFTAIEVGALIALKIWRSATVRSLFRPPAP